MSFKDMFKRKKEILKVKSSVTDYSFTPIYNNDAISLVHDACVICVDGKKKRSIEEKTKFIHDKVLLGHESILEHSNYIVKITADGDHGVIESLYEMVHCFKYLNIKVKQYKIDDDNHFNYDILIGGSVRGFKHIIRTIDNPTNPLYITIMEYVKQNIHSCFFSDLIKDCIFDKYDFLDDLSEYKNKEYRDNINWNMSGAYILSYDDLDMIDYNLNGEFTKYELADFACVNTVFVNVSRACSHQLVRHRAGITQLSQRYVDMKKAPMILPKAIKDNETADILQYNLDIYSDMLDEGIKKEDARYILPNACSTSLYMTFTYRGFIKAYELRTGKGAQQEIKDKFYQLGEQIKIDEDIIKPYYIYAEKQNTVNEKIDFNDISESIELDNKNEL